MIPRHYCMRAWKLFVKQRFRMVRCRRYTFPAVRLPVVTHQTGVIGFRGAVKRVDDQLKNAFVLFANGEERQGEERMGREIGTMGRSGDTTVSGRTGTDGGCFRHGL